MPIAIWSPTQRWLHWSIVLCLIIAWVSAGRWDQIHEWSGYVLFGQIGLRIGMAIFSSHPNTNGKKVLRKLGALPNYLKRIFRGKFSKTRGLSPTGVVTVISLLIITFIVNYTGLMLTFEDYVGEEWLETLHADLFYYSLVLVAMHVLGGFLFSYLQKENKFRDMLTGGK